MSAAAYDAPEAVVLEDFAKPDAFADCACQGGVTAKIESSSDPVKAGAVSGRYSARNEAHEPNGAWAKARRVFSPVLNIANQKALGVWVYGDGQGEVLNVQLGSPHHIARGIADHYVKVDFTGWRYFELIEPEGGHIEDYTWPYGGAYAIYREDVNHAHIESLSLWYNNLPKGKDAACSLSPIKALPLAACTVANPKVTIAGKTVAFPAEVESGCYLEFRSMTDCKLYGTKGELIREITPEGEAPLLEPGDNRIEFACDASDGVNPRAYVTVIGQGEPLRE